MGTHHVRRPDIRHDRVIAGVRYVSIGRASQELDWSREAIINWLTAKHKFTAGTILQVAIINGQRWFTWASVKAAKRALKTHGRFTRR